MASNEICRERNRARQASRHVQGAAPVPRMKKSSVAGALENGRQRFVCERIGRGNRPGPDAIRKTEERATMRQAGEAEATAAMGVNQYLARQMAVVH